MRSLNKLPCYQRKGGKVRCESCSSGRCSFVGGGTVAAGPSGTALPSVNVAGVDVSDRSRA